MKVVKLGKAESETSVKRSKRAAYRHVMTMNEHGEVLAESEYVIKPKNGSGFVLSYTQKMCDFLETCSTGSTVRIFIYIAHRQNYGVDGVFGFRTTRENLCKTLNLTRKTVYTALEFLKSGFYINELRIDGCFEYMVNPSYVTIGADRKLREREWTRRWAIYLKLQQAKNSV